VTTQISYGVYAFPQAAPYELTGEPEGDAILERFVGDQRSSSIR
jgi:hypothetical protein